MWVQHVYIVNDNGTNTLVKVSMSGDAPKNIEKRSMTLRKCDIPTIKELVRQKVI